jgi:hypothetical protein|tara:strand:+ start:134 stop:490 length:357 start_codon:yes stop_codon:yes gene_type:complete
MANAFKNAGVALSSTNATTLYQVPTGVNSSVVHSIYIANVDGSNSVNVNVEVSTDGAGSANFFHVAKTVPVPADASLILDKPINLFNTSTASAGDLIRVTASAASDLECFVSVLEITN